MIFFYLMQSFKKIFFLKIFIVGWEKSLYPARHYDLVFLRHHFHFEKTLFVNERIAE